MSTISKLEVIDIAKPYIRHTGQDFTVVRNPTRRYPTQAPGHPGMVSYGWCQAIITWYPLGVGRSSLHNMLDRPRFEL